jgi:hypothetical protein
MDDQNSTGRAGDELDELFDAEAARVAAEKVDGIVEQVFPILAGHDGNTQGSVIAEVLATYIVGHAPPIREQVMAVVLELAEKLIPVIEAEKFPNGWPATEAEA